jgi:hypothetical protein
MLSKFLFFQKIINETKILYRLNILFQSVKSSKVCSGKSDNQASFDTEQEFFCLPSSSAVWKLSLYYIKDGKPSLCQALYEWVA